jgi:hypothetical protein
MPFKDKEKAAEYNREHRAKDRLELKTLRSQVKQIKELVSSAPISESEVIPTIQKILSQAPDQCSGNFPPHKGKIPDNIVSNETTLPNPAPLNPYWQRQRDLAAQANKREIMHDD